MRPAGYFYLVLVALFTLGVGLAAPPAHADSAQPAPYCAPGAVPTFNASFADLELLLGPLMGEPVECEHVSPASGDTVQATTTGLAFYNDPTQTAIFTDGFHHWAATPEGPVAWSGSDAEPPSLPLRPVPEGAVCFAVGSSTCLAADPRLSNDMDLLGTTSLGPNLLQTAASSGVTLTEGITPAGSLGYFSPVRNTIVLSSTLDPGNDPRAVTTILAHELQHAGDWARQGPGMLTPQGCYTTEIAAFHTQSAVWVKLGQKNLPDPQSELDAQLQDIASAIDRNPSGFADILMQIYEGECNDVHA